ncbi:MAG: cyclase family protein [Pyrinomonadaceae bacterium]|nr:cyclase family protein [Pyrinomonadaceae bacterium]MCX7640747.1 cyclase family protein [Pyrinomonadaceae bacterium]MDW8304642.1 cyclase family protein [Acidobacteriota bacterium]
MIYDITFPIYEGMPIYEGDPSVRMEAYTLIAKGDTANVTKLCFGAHTATHIDAPNHFIEGARKVHEIDLEKMIGKCKVVDIEETVDAIEPKHLKGLEEVERILFKTKNSNFWNEPEKGFRKDFTYITPEAAKILAEYQIKLVGIDYLSVEKFGSEDFKTHITLLKREIVILEGLDLRNVPAGDYELICLPLKIINELGDGAPARAILRA